MLSLRLGRNTPLLDGVHSLCIPASYKSVRLQRLRSLAAPGGLATFAGMDDDQPTAEAARRKLATVMIDKLLDRLPGHTRTQRLALLQQAFSEMRHRCFSQPDPVELDAAGKPTPASSAEQAFTEVGDVLLDQMAAILDG